MFEVQAFFYENIAFSFVIGLTAEVLFPFFPSTVKSAEFGRSGLGAIVSSAIVFSTTVRVLEVEDYVFERLSTRHFRKYLVIRHW